MEPSPGARAGSSAEIGPQARVGPGELFGKDPGLRDDGDEVGVAGPAGQDMHVNVVRHSGARGAADVEPEVEPVRVVLRLEGTLTALRQRDQLAELALVEVGQPGDVAAGHDEE